MPTPPPIHLKTVMLIHIIWPNPMFPVRWGRMHKNAETHAQNNFSLPKNYAGVFTFLKLQITKYLNIQLCQ